MMSQFHYGSIKTNYSVFQFNREKTSQFHYGSIKTILTLLVTSFMDFGSQFHYGSIKTKVAVNNARELYILSQFHYGSIKTVEFLVKNALHIVMVSIPLWFD